MKVKILKRIAKALRDILKSIMELIDMEEAKEFDDKQTEMPIEEPRQPTRNEKALLIAQKQIGVKEISGPGNNAKVVEYHRYASKNNKVEQPDDVPWCSSFVCYVVEKAGMGSTNSMMARSWLKWGVSSKKNPFPGDVVVYWRGNKSGWKGHVGIYLATNKDGSIVTLGGNQSDEVNVTAYSSSKLLDIRRSSKARPYTADDLRYIYKIADQIMGRGGLAGMPKDGKVT